MEAKSLLPAIEGHPWQEREFVVCEQAHDTNFTTSDYESMIRTQDWKYVCFVDNPDGQLFDLVNDPTEVKNLWNSPAHADKKREMQELLHKWRMRSAHDHSGWRQAWPK
jgi:arylsulfatase A-like enzyme